MTGGYPAGTTASGSPASSNPRSIAAGPRGPIPRGPTRVLCHSLGGLVARWYIEKCGGADITRKLITLGTPWRGAGMALNKLSNGVPVKIGPIDKLNLDEFARSLPSLYQLLPEYACITSGEDYLKITETSIPELDTARAADAMDFHTDLQQAEHDRPASKLMTHMMVGGRANRPLPRSPSPTWKRWRRRASAPSTTTATAPSPHRRCRPRRKLDNNLIHRVADQHGNLQCNTANLDEITEIITAKTHPTARPAACLGLVCRRSRPSRLGCVGC